MPALPVSNIIDVSVSLQAPLAQTQNFNTMLILGTSDVIDTVQRMRTYADIASVAADFGGTAEEYLAAVKWFEQVPKPSRLNIGRWVNEDANGQLIGGAVSAANQINSVWTAISNGAALVYVDGVPRSLTGLNFGAVINMNGVANVIQTALAAQVSGSTVTWDNVYQRFVVTSGTTGATSVVSFFSDPTAIGWVTYGSNPSNNDTITIGGTLVTFKSSAPTGNQVLIGNDLAETLQNLEVFLNASSDVNLSQASYVATSTRIYIVYDTPGSGGNSFTLASSIGTPSGGTLAGGSGTTIATPTALKDGMGGYAAAGVDAETALEAVQVLDDMYSNAWYGLVVPSAVNNDHLAIAEYVDAAVTKHFYGVTTQDPNCLVPGNTSNIIYLLKAQGNNHCMAQYSSKTSFAVVSALARILTTYWNGQNTTMTLMFKQEPGVEPESLTLTQADALKSIYGNVFVQYNNETSILQFGRCASGQYVDTIIGVDWLAASIQTGLYNVLLSTPKIPQTDAGMHILATDIDRACDQARVNGLLGPGKWTLTGFGQLATGDFLDKGYYIYQPPISSQDPADRADRKSVLFQVAAKLAGAVHEASVVINVNQ